MSVAGTGGNANTAKVTKYVPGTELHARNDTNKSKTVKLFTRTRINTSNVSIQKQTSTVKARRYAKKTVWNRRNYSSNSFISVHSRKMSDNEQSTSTSLSPGKKRSANDEVVEHDENMVQPEGIAPPVKRFKAVAADTVSDWDIDIEMLEYVNSQFFTHVNEQALKDCIIKPRPVPSNVPKPSDSNLDDFLRDLLIEKRHNNEIQTGRTLLLIQKKVMQIMGPLSSLWQTLNESLNSSESHLEISIEQLNEEVEKVLTLT